MNVAGAVTVLTPVSPLPFHLGVGPETDCQDLTMMAWFLFGVPVILLSFFNP